MGVFQYTAISRKVVEKYVPAAIPKGNMGYDQYTVPDIVAVEPTFIAFFLALANIYPWPCHSFKIPLRKSEPKTTHDSFRDCRVHFF